MTAKPLVIAVLYALGEMRTGRRGFALWHDIRHGLMLR